MTTILLVDDDPAIRQGLQHLLTQAGYSTLLATNATEALARLEPPPQLIVLDVMLPDLDGFSLCYRIRQRTTYIPILMLTARDELADKVQGLETGADEYVTKPFEPRELLARVRAMLRFAEQQHVMHNTQANETPIVYGPLSFWRIRHRLEIADREIELTPTEWALLELLIEHSGQVFGRETLLRHVWGTDYVGDSRTVDTHIQRLRAKLQPTPQTPAFIHTVRGFGYRFWYDPAAPRQPHEAQHVQP